MIYAAADVLLAPTRSMRLQLSAIFPNKHIEVVGRGVNTRRFRPMPKDRTSYRALYVGRLSVEKGLDQLVFFNRHPHIQLILVGDGDDRQRLQQILPTAVFLGECYGRRLLQAYGRADLFVFPSRTDTYANVISEALSAGLPVVAFDDAGLEDRIKEGFNGLLVNSRAEFEAAVLALRQPALRLMMGRNARRTALALSWPAALEQQQHALRRAGEIYRRKLQRLGPIFRKVIYSFNFSYALLGSARMGFYVLLANVNAGLLPGITAGLRQAAISFFMVGINTSLYEYLYYRSVSWSILLPSLLTTTVGTTLHVVGGTPNPVVTACTIFALAIINFTMLAKLHQRFATISPWRLASLLARFLTELLRAHRRKPSADV